MLNSEAENQADVLADWDINIGNDIAKWASAIEELAGKRFLDESEIVSIRKNLAQLRETQANISKRNRKNYRSFETYGLEGQYFPVQFYDATAKTIMREIKDPHIASLVLRNIQSMMRLTGATADMSALGIQGWQALMLDVAKTTGRVLPQDQNKKLLNYNRSAPSMQAFKAMAKAFWGEDGKKVVQEYFLMKDAMAVKTGMMTPMQKAQSGLAILHNAPDLDLGLAGRVPGYWWCYCTIRQDVHALWKCVTRYVDGHRNRIVDGKKRQKHRRDYRKRRGGGNCQASECPDRRWS